MCVLRRAGGVELQKEDSAMRVNCTLESARVHLLAGARSLSQYTSTYFNIALDGGESTCDVIHARAPEAIVSCFSSLSAAADRSEDFCSLLCSAGAAGAP